MGLLLLLIGPFSSCGQANSKYEKQLRLPKLMKEVSGIAYDQQTKIFWMVNDSGNSPEVFGYDPSAEKITQVIKPDGAINIDWEDLALGPNRMLYVGDFGNNKSKRKDLRIYGFNLPTDPYVVRAEAWVLDFSLEDQTEFPPKSKKKSYDIEAFFYHQGHFYLFSRNRARKFDGQSNVYRLVAEPGKQVAKKIGQFDACKDRRDCQITSAAISPDQSTIALLTYNKIYTITDFDPQDLLAGRVTKYKLQDRTQKESISFIDSNMVVIADERSGGKGRNLYWVALDQLEGDAKSE